MSSCLFKLKLWTHHRDFTQYDNGPLLFCGDIENSIDAADSVKLCRNFPKSQLR